jgi:outer membrane protein assembly factor BamB
MTIAQTNEQIPRKPLRLWPGVVAVALQWLALLVSVFVIRDALLYGMMAAALLSVAIAVWWLFFSRAPWSERLGAIIVMVIAVIATKRVVHPSIENAAMGKMVYFFSVPPLCLALVSWAAATRRLSSGPRRAWMVVAIVLACVTLTLVRTGGITGDARSDLHWRWTPTPEQRLLAQGNEVPIVPPSAPAPAAAATPEKPLPAGPTTPAPTVAKVPEPPRAPVAEPPATWPGFRGPNRDSVIPGVQIDTDWSKSPPVELWRRKVGPGWSSFAVRGDLVYTQEQRGDEEDVSCYSLTSGKLVWRHRDAARFWESNGGAGPRATPAVSDGRVYTHGATGIVNALDAGTGAVVWSRNASSDTGAPRPGWGFTSSPLVVGDMVIIASSGRLAAYDVATGNPRWYRKTGGGSYSSAQLMTIGDVPQIVLLNGAGVTSVAPADGAVLWEHAWPGAPIVQPARTADGDLLIATADMMGGLGMRRLAVTHAGGKWTVEERWSSRGLKPYFNDFVVHQGYAYGFDGPILSCIDLTDGARKWKGGRYGNGQLVLLPDQDLLLVLSEDGELALVKATPDQFTELARIPALNSKTWNHPVLAGDVLLVRNGEEMAAFRLSMAVRSHE